MSLIEQIKDIQKLNITTKNIKTALEILTFDYNLKKVNSFVNNTNFKELEKRIKKLANKFSNNNEKKINEKVQLEHIYLKIQLDNTNFKDAIQNVIYGLKKLDKKLRKDKAKLKYLKRMRNRNKLYLKNRK